MKSPINDMTGRGILSAEPIRNIRYHLIVTAALITRFCIESGMNSETAYSLSDLYIQRADQCTSAEQLVAVHKEMYIDFTSRMKLVRKTRIFSKHVVLCMDYIQNHLQQTLTVAQLAQHAGLNESYLSKLFKAETGESVSGYIRKKKIDAAKDMLKFLEFSSLSIGSYLAFSSQSHFIQVFKKHTGITPEEYRKEYFRSSWMQNR